MNNDFLFNQNMNFQYSNYWSKYDNLLKDMSNEQKVFVGKNKNVLQAKQNLISAFIDYLFEQQKNNFVLVNDSAKSLADEYIKAIEKAASSYVTRSEELEKENMDLKKQIQQLMLDFGEKKNGKDKPAAERT